ncbi:4Fe-4S ferredoxin [Aphanothece hegewaldii CCALA 016]|uniref:4Fe-4S ferredoxin n=1 Tax=Aphanothece hegewaldii CCALA 016 TaxID=2107694 RepID=A0A2T1LRY0_9CHRO|nr:LdpA C-terminal domain-containing domain [Aphanothece hegewaldii]PSF31987.1 4Fe-4S ferredoxin [Aphanothece hegewaldii CCALA 016]
MNKPYSPLNSLEEGHWFKLICGASYQDLPTIRSLSLAYTLAGVDCIDVAADPAVITAAKEGIEAAQNRPDKPWLMVSLNDGEDPHFRKAEFNPELCPLNCPRPCESVCPASAIDHQGVIDQRCYGCGRCIPICPDQIIVARSYVSTPTAVTSFLQEMGVDAIEIHTQVGHLEDFKRLWSEIKPISEQLKLLAISCQDHPNLIPYLTALSKTINPLSCPLIWQTDGRPMSGDIGKGTTHPAIKMAQKVLSSELPGYVQLAGGTNHHTVTKLKEMGLLKTQNGISGVAYGSYARALLLPILEELESQNQPLENHREYLKETVSKAYSLVGQLKSDFLKLPPSFLAD